MKHYAIRPENKLIGMFGIPAAVAAISSVFGVRALFSGLLSSRVKSNISAMMIISVAMVLLLCVVEYIYMAVVKKSSNSLYPDTHGTGTRRMKNILMKGEKHEAYCHCGRRGIYAGRIERYAV